MTIRTGQNALDDKRLPITGYSHIDSPHQYDTQPVAVYYSPGRNPYNHAKGVMVPRNDRDPLPRVVQDPTSSRLADPGRAFAPHFDPWELVNAYATDSYIRRAVDAYATMIGKEGYTIEGTNPAAVEYVKARLRWMQYTFSRGWTFDQVLRMIEMSLVLFGGAPILKVSGKAAIPSVSAKPVFGKGVLSGLRPMHLGFLQAETDGGGGHSGWAYDNKMGAVVKLPLTDVVYIRQMAMSDSVFSEPFIYSALDDLRAYRQLEWQVVMLVNRFLNPLIHVRKGVLPDGSTVVGEVTQEVLNEARQLIQDVAADGTLITGPDFDVKIHGSESLALRVEGHIRAWQQRVAGGLRMPPMLLGMFVQMNTQSSDALTAVMHDTVKGFQQSVADALNAYVIQQLLLEGGFDPMADPSIAVFSYNNVSMTETLKGKDQAIREWVVGGMTETEFRKALGLPPMTDEGRETTYQNLYGDLGAAASADSTAASNTEPGGGKS